MPDRLQVGPRGFRVLGQEVPAAGGLCEHAVGQDRSPAVASEIGARQQIQDPRSRLSSRKYLDAGHGTAWQSADQGQADKAVGSFDSTLATSAMPSDSIFAAPAQSYGSSRAEVALQGGTRKGAHQHGRGHAVHCSASRSGQRLPGPYGKTTVWPACVRRAEPGQQSEDMGLPRGAPAISATWSDR